MATENYALLIGVEDYSVLDRSEGRAAGASNVVGAAQDARVWLQQCLAWGFDPSHIRLCTSPVSNASYLGVDGARVHISDASRASLESGLNWLADALSRNPASSGLITFSGHGEQGRGIVLCPADMSATEQNLLNLPDIRNLIGGGPGVGSVTIVLDCCREGTVIKERNAIRPRMRRWGRRFGMGMARGPGDARVLAACEPNSAAVSSTFGGHTMGAFTWALTSVLGQWQTIQKDNVTRLDASYGEVLHRTRMLLQALSFDQIPVLQGAPAIDALPFLEPTGERVRGRTVSEPTCRRRRRQLDPSELDFRTYLLRYSDPSGVVALVATIVVTSTAGTVETSEGSFDLRADDEYWFVSSDALNRITSGSSGTLTLSVEGDYNYRSERGGETWAGNVTGYQLVQNTPAPATWRTAATSFPSGAIVFESADQSVALALLLQQDPGANSTGFRRVDFFQTGSNPLFYQNRTAVYTMAQRSSAGAPNSRYNQAISDFELFADLA